MRLLQASLEPAPFDVDAVADDVALEVGFGDEELEGVALGAFQGDGVPVLVAGLLLVCLRYDGPVRCPMA